MSSETLIRCCAPTLASLKTGNMFNCAFDRPEQMFKELRELNQRLQPKGLRMRSACSWVIPRRMWTVSCTGRMSASSAASGRFMTMWKAPSGSLAGAGTARKSI